MVEHGEACTLNAALLTSVTDGTERLKGVVKSKNYQGVPGLN